MEDKLTELEMRIRALDEFRTKALKNEEPYFIQNMIEDELIKYATQHLALCEQRLDFYKSL